jgi:iron complex transport system substrate-binding protein
MLTCGDAAPDPSRIAVAGGSLTEILYDLGEAERVIAVDRTSNYPQAALELPQIGYVRNLSAEGLLSLSPTLVLGEHDMGPPAVIEQLEALGVDVLRVPEEFDGEGIARKIRCVAAAVGADAFGEDLVAALDASDAGVEPPAGDAPRGVVILTFDSGAPLAAGRDTSGDGLLRLAGARNQLADVEGWKPVSVEAMAAAAPEFIVITERGLAAAGGMDALRAHPALRLTPAAQKGNVIAMDGMAMLGFGPRTLGAAADLREKLGESSR